MSNQSNNKQWYKDLDISSKGQPTGIDKIDQLSPNGLCYCITRQNNIATKVDVYKDGQKIHYKKFRYDELGRVIVNMMYSPDDTGEWHIVDDVWYYEYDPKTGLRTKKIMRMPGSSTAQEIAYDKEGNRIRETTITIASDSAYTVDITKGD